MAFENPITLDTIEAKAEAAANAAALAQLTANNAQTAANAAQSAASAATTEAATARAEADAAQTTANQALTSANGKNKVIYSTSSPSGAGTRVDDTWFMHDANNVVIGQWRWTGTLWQPQTLGSAVIAALDAGKITTGMLVGLIIQGTLFRTAETGKRIVLNPAVNKLEFYSGVSEDAPAHVDAGTIGAGAAIRHMLTIQTSEPVTPNQGRARIQMISKSNDNSTQEAFIGLLGTNIQLGESPSALVDVNTIDDGSINAAGSFATNLINFIKSNFFGEAIKLTPTMSGVVGHDLYVKKIGYKTIALVGYVNVNDTNTTRRALGITLDPEFRPLGETVLGAYRQYGGSGEYRYIIGTNGVVEFQQTAGVNSTFEAVSGVWFTP